MVFAMKGIYRLKSPCSPQASFGTFNTYLQKVEWEWHSLLPHLSKSTNKKMSNLINHTHKTQEHFKNVGKLVAISKLFKRILTVLDNPINWS